MRRLHIVLLSLAIAFCAAGTNAWAQRGGGHGGGGGGFHGGGGGGFELFLQPVDEMTMVAVAANATASPPPSNCSSGALMGGMVHACVAMLLDRRENARCHACSAGMSSGRGVTPLSSPPQHFFQ